MTFSNVSLEVLNLAFQSIFINLPVKDLKKSTRFFKELGFVFNPQFSDETTSCMIGSEHIFVLIMTEEKFKRFTKKDITDTSTSSEAIFCLSADSRAHVDGLVNSAVSAGGKTYRNPDDHGFMYIWGFEDIDGHLWEIAYMDPSALNES